MGFVFITEDEDEEETLDLSDLISSQETDKKERESNSTRVGTSKANGGRLSKKESTGDAFSFEEEIPRAKRITDPDVKTRARRGRKTSLNHASYENKREAGWSLYCSHKKHLPTLCEREQDAHKITCTCPCHEARGYVQPEPEYIPGSDDEEILILID